MYLGLALPMCVWIYICWWLLFPFSFFFFGEHWMKYKIYYCINSLVIIFSSIRIDCIAFVFVRWVGWVEFEVLTFLMRLLETSLNDFDIFEVKLKESEMYFSLVASEDFYRSSEECKEFMNYSRFASFNWFVQMWGNQLPIPFL